jgi:hypothetical protein
MERRCVRFEKTRHVMLTCHHRAPRQSSERALCSPIANTLILRAALPCCTNTHAETRSFLVNSIAHELNDTGMEARRTQVANVISLVEYKSFILSSNTTAFYLKRATFFFGS